MTANTIPQTDVDVLVAGAGNAALVAALAAHDAGARVLVLEAAPHEERGGNSRFSGGIFRIAHGGIDDLAPLVTEESRRWVDRPAASSAPSTRAWGSSGNLFDTVERAGIDVVYDAPVQDLITSGDRVLGVRVRQPDQDVSG